MLYPKKKVHLVLTMICLLTGNAHMVNEKYIKLHRCSRALLIYFFVHLLCNCSFNNMQEIHSCRQVVDTLDRSRSHTHNQLQQTKCFCVKVLGQNIFFRMQRIPSYSAAVPHESKEKYLTINYIGYRKQDLKLLDIFRN